MYKVMHWYETLICKNDFAKVEHYFTDSKEALKFYYGQRKLYKNVALVVSAKHTEFVFMSHYSEDFPKELRPDVFRVSRTDIIDLAKKYIKHLDADADIDNVKLEIDSTDKTVCMYDVFMNVCGFKMATFRFNADGSVEEI